MEKERLPEFIRIQYQNKVALIDPHNKICLEVSRKMADNLQVEAVYRKIFAVWKSQLEQKNNHQSRQNNLNTFYLILTRLCNLHCEFCAINAKDKVDPEGELSTGSFSEKIIPYLAEFKPRKLVITGGEPLLRKDLSEICSILRNSYSGCIILQSNGVLFSLDTLHRIRGNVDEIDFSTTHMLKTLSGTEKLIDNIEICNKYGFKVALSYVFHKGEENYLFRAIDLAVKYDTYFILNFVAPIGGAEDGSGTMNDIEKLNVYIEIARYILRKKYAHSKVADAILPRVRVESSCGAYGRVMAVFPDGEIYMCQSVEGINKFRLGNIREDSPQMVSRTLRRKLCDSDIQDSFCVECKEKCRECEYRYFCGGGCPATGQQKDECDLQKAIIKYSLFIYDKNKSHEENISNYISVLDSYKSCQLNK